MSAPLPSLDPTWVGPYWFERQGDPESPSFVPGTWLGPSMPGPAEGEVAPAPVGNRTQRRAVSVGSLWTAPRALVDERGLVVPHGRGWSLDWWVRAEDRWHHPSRARAVRQRIVGLAPVVETVLRVPGGDVVHRVAGFLDGPRPALVVEIENGSAVPVALAIAVRPYDLAGHAPVRRLVVDRRGIEVDGGGAVRFTRAPADVVVGTAATGDPAALVGHAPGSASGDGPLVVEDADGWASAVAVFPLAHTATLRVVVPLDAPVPEAPGRRGRRRAAALTPTAADPDAALVEPPPAEQVAKGWDVQLRRGLQVELPDQKLDDAYRAARAQLLLLAGGRRLAVAHLSEPGRPDLGLAGAAEVVSALDESGFADEAADVLRGWADRQAPDGELDRELGRMGSTGAALGAVADHWRLTRDSALVDDLIVVLAKGAHWLAGRRTDRRAPRDAGGDALLPRDSGAPDIGPVGQYPRDSAGAARALQALAAGEVAAGQPDVAEDARSLAAALASAVDAWLAQGEGPIPAALGRAVDAGVVASLDLVADRGTVPPDHPRVAATVAHVREHGIRDGLVFRGLDRRGADPAATLRLAQVAIANCDPRAIGDLDAVVDAGGPTACWPTVLHPATGGGSDGRFHDPVVTARFVRTIRSLLVRELPDDRGLALCSLVPERWWGQPLDVRDAPTAFGRCSFSIRWHGERPALLWELDLHDEVGGVTITAPGLDPTWSTTDPRGEALLAAPVAPAADFPAADDAHVEPAASVDAAGPTFAPGPAGDVEREAEGEVEVEVDLRVRPRDEPSPPPSADGGDSFS